MIMEIKTPELITCINGLSKDRFGITNQYNLAGYLLTDGSMLDFSAGQSQRVVDHREINFIYQYKNKTRAMIDFMNLGNIRMLDLGGVHGIDMSVSPTEEQEETLYEYFSLYKGEVYVDYSSPTGAAVGNGIYRKGTSPKRVLDDIRSFFSTGWVPKGTAE